MSSFTFSILFMSFLFLSLLVKFWLSYRHINYIFNHRDTVPSAFLEKISLASHQKAADYTIAKTKFGLFTLLIDTLILISFTFLGGLQWLSNIILNWLNNSETLYQLILIGIVIMISGLINLIFDYYRQFNLEEHFNFNKMTQSLFFLDTLKSIFINLIISLPLLWIILILMEKSGKLWWFYVWLVWSSFQFLMLILYPNFIAPVFNKFTPLEDSNLRTRIENLMYKVGFKPAGLFVMDSSKHSTHGNAYLTGFGASKRIVFFDTLLTRLAPHEIEAVLAHELGHFKLQHILKRIIVVMSISFVFLMLLGFLKNQVWFYIGLGVHPLLFGSNDAMALILFMLMLPIFTFFLLPLSSLSSRKHEFEADHFATQYIHPQNLISALVKLYEDNASTLTPDSLYSAFYDSHPPALVRISKLHHYIKI